MPGIQTVIFDLDGTLIDSSTSILAGFAAAFAELGRTPARPLAPEIIGPPLKDTLAMLAGTDDPALIDALATGFKAHYDSEGYKATEVFAGVPELLAGLAQRRPLHIATNKRLDPTLKILNHLGWTPHFGQIRALDAWTPPAKNKTDMIGRLLKELSITPEAALYVGDREEDYLAARSNKMRFALATWGYGAAPAIDDCRRLSRPADLLTNLV